MPFGEYESWEDCIAKNKDKDDPEAYCGKIKHETEGAQVQTGNQTLAVFSEPFQIVEDSHCCLKVSAVIAKEGIYDFPAGPNGENRRCLWSRQELLKAAKLAKIRPPALTILDHPPNRVVTSQEEVFGSAEATFFDRDRIRTTLNYSKELTPFEFLETVRAAASKTGPPKDVSQGFYYIQDETPGEWHGQHYDLVMRNIVIDHVATGVQKGRCTYPNCGIGVSTVELAALLKPKEVPPVVAETPPPPPPATPPPVETPPPPPPPPAPLPSAKELIDRCEFLMKVRGDMDIERERQKRRQPLLP